jgi:hypothetical protein
MITTIAIIIFTRESPHTVSLVFLDVSLPGIRYR